MRNSIFRTCVNWLALLFLSPSERNYALECSKRAHLDDDEFVRTYFDFPQIRRDVPLRVRKVFATQLGFNTFLPTDRLADIIGDADIAELLKDLEEEFEIVIARRNLPEALRSFDSIVRLVNDEVVRIAADKSGSAISE